MYLGPCVGQPGSYLLLHTQGLFTLMQCSTRLITSSCVPERGFTQAVGLAPTDHSPPPSHRLGNGPLGS